MSTLSLRRTAVTSAIVLVGLAATASSALAASISDGTSNTVMFGEVVGPRTSWVFSDVMVESLKGTPVRTPASN